MPSLISSNINHPVEGLAFLCAFMGMPFSTFGNRWLGVVIGAVNLALMAGCFALAWQRGFLKVRLGVVVFGLYLFTLLSALLTTAARMDPNEAEFNQAKAWRYITMPTVGWALLTVTLVWLAANGRSWYRLAIAAVAIASFFCWGLNHASAWVDGTRGGAANGQIATTMLLNNVFDPDQARAIFPDAELVRAYSKVLRDNRKSIWSRGPDKWIGQDVRHLLPQNTPIAGQVTRVYPVPGGLELFGWADTNSLTDDHEMLFVDDNYRIAGFGRRPPAGMPADLGAWDTPTSLAFVGFVSIEKPVYELSVYVRTFHGKMVQPLAGKIRVPSFTDFGSRTDTPVLPGITWRPDATWTPAGYTHLSENGPAPPGVIYASWSGSDARTGEIHTDLFAAPSNHCLVLPVLDGGSGYGQSVEVRDGDTNQSLANLPILDGRAVWKRWQIPIPDATQNVTIVADDQGTGPYQWLAVATPEQCP
jgi:hypothetical protein